MSKNKTKNTPSNSLIDTSDLLFVWRLIAKNIALIVIIPILAYAVGYLYSYRLTNIYGASAQFLLKSNETYDYQDPIYKGLGAYGAYMDVQNQIRILRSRDLVGEVIDKIGIETSYFVVGRLKRHEVFRTLPFITSVTVLNPSIYEVPIAIYILDENKYKLKYELDDKVIEKEYFFNQEFVTDDFVIRLDRMYSFNSENIDVITYSEYEIVFHSRDYLISKYQSSMSVENIEYTSVLEVYVTDELEERAKVFLDTLTNTYIDFSERVQIEVNQNTLDNIQKQLDTIGLFLEEKEQQLLKYKDQNSILHVTKEEDEFFAEYVIYSKQKRDLEEKRNSIKLLNDYITNSSDDRTLPPSFYIERNDVYLSEAIGKIRTKQLSLEIRKTQESEDNTNMINLRKEIAMLKNDVRTYLVNLADAIDKEIQETEVYIERFESNMKQLPKSAQDIMNIQREIDVNTRMYLFLLEKKTNTLIARAGIIPQVMVIEKATKLGIIEPDKNKMKRLFLLGGIILALVVALIRKMFFEKLENLKELSEVSSLSVLGGLSYQKNLKPGILALENPKAQISEEFRRIRTNLSYMANSSKKSQKVLISSFFPGEGKTFCSSNLAALIARGEKKVLLIDLDLHRPKIHKVFNLSNAVGLSGFIIEKSTKEEIIHKQVTSNLDIITAGPIAPNPSELIQRATLRQLIEWAEENYDYVIIDTPPFGLLNDTFELVKMADLFLVVMNTQYTRKRGVMHMEEMLGNIDSVSVGAVLNGIRTGKLKYYYAKYSYRYTYGYSYGYEYNNYTQEND